MRLKVVLEPEKTGYQLPLNYMYPLSAVVYRIFSAGSEEVANRLHNIGYINSHGKGMKLFHFSFLKFERYEKYSEHFKCFGQASFVFSAPVETELIDTFVSGIFNCQEIIIGNRQFVSHFRMKQVEVLKPYEFTNEETFRAITPITVSTMIEMNGKLQPYYIIANEPDYVPALKQNLLEKYEILYGRKFNGELDITLLNPDKAKSKLLWAKEGTKAETKVRGFLLDFKINSTPEMMQIIYNCGIGEKGSMGFGMVEVMR
jgi:CRISPR-associated endoribonuclease Cas6